MAHYDRDESMNKSTPMGPTLPLTLGYTKGHAHFLDPFLRGVRERAGQQGGHPFLSILMRIHSHLPDTFYWSWDESITLSVLPRYPGLKKGAQHEGRLQCFPVSAAPEATVKNHPR